MSRIHPPEFRDRGWWRPLLLVDELDESVHRDAVGAADVDRADLAGLQEPVDRAAADAEPAGGLDDGEQHPLIGYDVDVDDLLRHRGAPSRLR